MRQFHQLLSQGFISRQFRTGLHCRRWTNIFSGFGSFCHGVESRQGAFELCLFEWGGEDGHAVAEEGVGFFLFVSLVGWEGKKMDGEGGKKKKKKEKTYHEYHSVTYPYSPHPDAWH